MKSLFLAYCTAATILLSAGPATAAAIFFDDFESYAIADPADMTPNWVHNGLGTAPNASRIFHTNNFGGSDLWIASGPNAAAGSGIDSTATITLDPNTKYEFSAALVTETFNGTRTATGTYDLLIGATSLIGGPQPFTARGDDIDGATPNGSNSYDDQMTTHLFNSGAGGNLTIKIAYNGRDASNPFVGIDNVSITQVPEPASLALGLAMVSLGLVTRRRGC